MTCFGGLALLLLVPVASHAALLSAQDLITACSGDPQAKATCDGYLMAVTDLILLRESRGHNGKICVPEAVTRDQIRDAVMNVAQRPRAAHAPNGAAVVMMALRATWPCNDAPNNAAPKQQ
jgi:hypothetical protein